MLLLIPLGIMGSNVHYGHVYTAIVAVTILLALFMPNDWLKLFGLYFAGWVAFAEAWAFTHGVSLAVMVRFIDAALFFWLGLIYFLSIYYNRASMKAWSNIICVAAILQAALGIFQHFGIDAVWIVMSKVVNLTSELPDRTAVGTLGNNNFLAAFIAISLPFFFRRRWAYFLPLILYGLWVTHTRTAMIASIAGLAYYVGNRAWHACEGTVIERNRKALLSWLISLSVITVFFYWFIDGRTLGKRPDYWLDGIQQVVRSWSTIIFGYGPAAAWRPSDALHSEYLAAVYGFGIIGLGLITGYIITIFRSNIILFTAFIILCIDAIGNHPMHTVPTALLAITIMALIERERRIEKCKR